MEPSKLTSLICNRPISIIGNEVHEISCINLNSSIWLLNTWLEILNRLNFVSRRADLSDKIELIDIFKSVLH